MSKFREKIKYIIKMLSSKTEHTVARILFNYSLKISTAESCTGGLLSSRLTDIAGSSSYTKENFVTYSNDAKKNLLDVSEETLEKYGAVSEECAVEMAEGLFKKTGCDIAISTTGVAGPTTPQPDAPVGTLYIAIKNECSTQVKKVEIQEKNSRKMMKYMFTQFALEFLIEFLQKNYVNAEPQLSDPTN